ncbi:MAG TPA: peptide deformylase [bacterium]|nr:peptide deformylase [Myxococcales bacterium]HPW44847.1 peptide deformylase [bacterium]
MIRKIITHPNPILRKVAKPVLEVDDEIRTLLADMVETMYADGGVGLAAPQVAVSLRVIVIDIDSEASEKKYGVLKIVNPEITDREGQIEWEEGCLSVPDFRIKMKRSARVTLRYLDENGIRKTLDCKELLSIAVQHEIDHLDGKLIIDCASGLKQDMYLKKIEKKKKEGISF